MEQQRRNAPSYLYFSSSSPNHNRSTKNNQPEQSIKSNNQKKTIPATIQSKTTKKQTVKTNTTNYLINQSQNQSHKQSQQTTHISQSKPRPKTNTTSNYDKMQCFLNIKISQATVSKPTANTLFIKTQRKYTRQPGQLLFGTRYSNHEKVIFFIFRYYKTRKKIYLI